MNPLRQNRLHIKALQEMVPDVRVCGRVVFAGEAKFPNGLPAGVWRIADLERDLADQLCGDRASGECLAAWEKLKVRSKTGKDARKAHLNGVGEKKGGELARPAAFGMLAVSMLWLFVLRVRS